MGLPSDPEIGNRGRQTTSDDRGGLPQGLVQIDPGLLPVALDGALRDALHAGDLREGEAAEELQVDDGREPRVDGGELVEGVTDASELGTVWHRARDVGRDRRELDLAAALRFLPAAHGGVEQA